MTGTHPSFSPPEPEFGRHLREMARMWKLIAGVTLSVGFTVLIIRAAGPEVFTSTSVLQVQLPDDVFDDGENTQFRTESLAELATAPSFLNDAIRISELDISVTEADRRVEIGLRNTPGFLEVTASGPSAEDAAGLTRALAARLAVEGTDQDSGVVTEVVVVAREPDEPISPRPLREGILAAIIAMLLTGESVVILRKLRGRVSPIDPAPVLERAIGVPTLDLRGQRAQDGRLLPYFAANLAQRPVITVIQRGGQATAGPASQLASAASGLSRRVLLIDADLAQPVLHKWFGHPQAPGLAEVLSGQQTLRGVVRRASDTNPAAVLSAGSYQADLAGVDRVLATHEVVAVSGADCALLSTTSGSSLDDALLVAHHFGEAVVLAVDPALMKEAEIRNLAARCKSVGARLVGVVLYTAPDGNDFER